jgi:hypothetical protein
MARTIVHGPPPTAEHSFEYRQVSHLPGPDQPVPDPPELLPAGGVRQMAAAVDPVLVMPGTARDVAPGVERSVRVPVARFELLGRHPGRLEDRVPGVVAVPVVVQQPPFGLHPAVETGRRVRRQDVKGRRLDALRDSPFHGPVEDGGVVIVHAEDEARIDHHAELTQPTDRGGVVATQVLPLVVVAQVALADRLEAHEQAAQTACHGRLENVRLEHRLHGPGRLPQPSHPSHAGEQLSGEAPVAEQVVVQEVQMPAGQAVHLGQRIVHGLGVEGPAALEECFLVTEVAGVRTAAGDHDRVRHQVEMALDQVASDRRQAVQRARDGRVRRGRVACGEVREEPRPGVLARTDEDRVRMPRTFLRQRRRVEPADDDIGAACPVVVGDLVRPSGRGDIGLDHDQVGLVGQPQRLDVLVVDAHVDVRTQVRRERRQTQGREQRVLDRAE